MLFGCLVYGAGLSAQAATSSDEARLRDRIDF